MFELHLGHCMISPPFFLRKFWDKKLPRKRLGTSVESQVEMMRARTRVLSLIAVNIIAEINKMVKYGVKGSSFVPCPTEIEKPPTGIEGVTVIRAGLDSAVLPTASVTLR
jgi:hypothetical protein